MEFSDILKFYMKELHMTAKELAETTELSPSVISRYRSGERVPALDSPQFEAIVRALGKKAKQLEHPTLGKKTIRAAFEDSFRAKENTETQLAPRLSALMSEFGISQAAMARGCGYDPSQLSRIRKGQRLPADVEHFIDAVATFISSNYTTPEDLQKLQALLMVESLDTKASAKKAIATWLHANDATAVFFLEKPKKEPKKDKKKTEKRTKEKTEPRSTAKAASNPEVPTETKDAPAPLSDAEKSLERLLGIMDSFHLQQYLRRLSKDTHRKGVLHQLADRVTTNYKNLPEIRQGMISFLRDISKESIPSPLYWEDDITGGLAAMNSRERTQLITALIHVLQRNHTLCVAQPIADDVAAVLDEIEIWLPLYMAGNMRSYRVAPGKKEDYRNLSIFTEEHILYGTSVSMKSNEALAYRKSGATEISYAMEQFQKLIRQGQSLITVYRRNQRKDYQQYLLEYWKASGTMTKYSNTLPLATINEELLDSILVQNRVEESECARIRNYRKYMLKQMKDAKISYICPVITKEQFATHPLTLDLSDLFLGAAVFYSYEEYESHVASTRAFAKEHSGFLFQEKSHIPYAHLSITSKVGLPTIISKDASPANHFIVSDPIIADLIQEYLKRL